MRFESGLYELDARAIFAVGCEYMPWKPYNHGETNFATIVGQPVVAGIESDILTL